MSLNDHTPLKKILLAAPNHFDIYHLMQKDLIALGYDVTIVLSEIPFQYNNFLQRAYNFFRKVVFKDFNFKKKLIHEKYKNYFNEKISEQAEFDYALFLRADLFDSELIQLAKAKSNKLISYHYDGLKRYPGIFGKIQLFDKFFVFDPEDLGIDEKVSPVTNCYFEFNSEINYQHNNHPKNNFYYLGSYEENRFAILKKLIAFTKSRNISAKFEILFTKKIKNKEWIIKKNPEITFIKSFRKYESYMDLVKNSKVIIDLVVADHNGLSFRVFEALKYKKKLITTNQYVKYYDFYDSNNIFILKEDNYNDLDEFLASEYKKLDQKLYEKYGFTNWSNYILDIAPHIPIHLPSYDY